MFFPGTDCVNQNQQATWLMRPAELDRSRMHLPADALWIGLGVVLGAAVRVIAAWNGGGVGGLFGWGPDG